MLLQVDRRVALDGLYPALTALSGIGVLVVGGWLAWGRLRALRPAGQGHQHGGGRRGHHHPHHGPPGVAPLSWRGLVLLATAGGIVPSPSAVIVLVGAFALRRVALGLGLVLAFSIGLAVTLTAVGLAFVAGTRVLDQPLHARLAPVLPILGAVALLGVGVTLLVQGARSL